MNVCACTSCHMVVQAAIDKAEQMRSSTRQKKQETGKKNAIAELRAAQERKTTQAK